MPPGVRLVTARWKFAYFLAVGAVLVTARWLLVDDVFALAPDSVHLGAAGRAVVFVSGVWLLWAALVAVGMILKIAAGWSAYLRARPSTADALYEDPRRPWSGGVVGKTSRPGPDEG